MNKAIVITYTGSEITDLQRASIENIVSAACDNIHDLIVTTTFDNNDIAKALLAYGTKNATIRFEEQSKRDEQAEAIQKAVYFIKRVRYLSGGHSLCIHGNNLLVYFRDVFLSLFDNLWFKS